MKTRIHPAWIVAGITFGTLFATAGFRSAPSVLILPLEADFGWSRNVISLAVAINVLLYGLTAPFAAALMERFTVRKVVMAALTTVGTGALLTIWMSQSWHLMLLWGVVVGVGTGSMALVFAATIANRWFVKKRGLVIGILTAAAASGQLVFLPGLSKLAADPGWRASSLVIALGAYLMVPLIYLFLKEDPQSINSTPYGAAEDWQPPVLQKGNAAKNAIQSLKDASKVRNFWYLVGSFFVCGLSTSGLVGTHFIPAAHDHGMVQVTAASLLALIGVFDVIGTIYSGYLTDRIDPRKLLFFYYMLRGLSLFLLPSILFSTLHPSTLVFVIFYGLDWVATVPPTVLLCRQVLGPDKGAVVYGWVFAAHQIGGSIAAIGASLLRVKFGDYASAFYITGILCVITSYFVLQISTPKVKRASKVMSSTFYERVGGEKTFNDLVSHFYALVAVNPILRPMYPENDLHGAGRRLQMFLEQYWGGPTTYGDERGHPRLRMRHAQFHISRVEHDAWLLCMKDAVNGLEIADDLKSELWEYLEAAAAAMINAPE